MRRKARELAFKVLFEQSFGNSSFTEAWHNSTQNLEPDDDSDDPLDKEGLRFALELVEGFEQNEESINAVLESTIQGWSFGQMAKTDLAVLRLAAYEMLYQPTPHAPLIEVAVKIAKRFGGEDSGRFVNGVLARLFKRIEAGELEAVAKSS